MELSDLKKYLKDVGLPPDYSVDTDKTKGGEIKGFDQITINWKQNHVHKSVQIFPEILEMNIKRWNLGVCAWMDNEGGRQFWTQTLLVKKTKGDMIAAALQGIKRGIERLNDISANDLKSTRH